MTPVLNYTIDAATHALMQEGKAALHGAIIKEISSGRILSHVQPTAVAQSMLQRGGSLLGSVANIGNPAGLVSQAGALVQNEQIKRKLDTVTQGLSNVQALQLANLATSVVGIGVTVASTALILSRLSGMKETMDRLEAKLDELKSDIAASQLRPILTTLETNAERLDEVMRGVADPSRAEVIEQETHTAFNALHRCVMDVSLVDQMDEDQIASLLSAMALSGGLQVKALLYVENFAGGQHRAQTQFDRVVSLSRTLSSDRLAEKFGPGQTITPLLSGLRLSLATQPDLLTTLESKGLSGRNYIEQAQSEHDAPLLFLAA